MKRQGHRSGSLAADAAYLLPLGRIGVDYSCQAAELAQQRSGRRFRDAWDRGQSGFRCGHTCRPRTLGVGWAAAVFPSCAPLDQSLEPASRVCNVLRPYDLDAQIHDGNASASDRGGSDRPVVEVLAFDDQIGESCYPANAAQLRPEGAFHDGEMETARCLPLDDCSIAYFVVSCPESLGRHVKPELSKLSRHRNRLAAINHDLRHSRSFQATECRVSAATVSKQQQLALSRSESA
jgi:hypothetical protein